MYRNTDAVIRPELNTVVEEAAAADSYFVGLRVFPVFNSTKKTGEYLKITKAASEVMKMNVTERAPKSPYAEVDRTYEKDNFTCVDRGISEALDDSVSAELADWFATEVVTSKLLLRSVLLGIETRVKDQVFSPTNFDAVNSTVAYQAANKATIDFAADVQAAIKRVKKRGEMANTMVLNRDMYDLVRTSDLFAKFLFGPLGGGQNITEEMLGRAFGIPNVLIADATYDSTPKGQNGTPSYVWGSDYIWIGNVQGGDFSAGGAGRTIVWTEDTASTFVTETFRDELRRSDIIRVRTHTAEKVISKPCGTLITTQA